MLKKETIDKRLNYCKDLKMQKTFYLQMKNYLPLSKVCNQQNSSVWCKRDKKRFLTKINRVQKAKSVMVWAGIAHDAKKPLFFIKAIKLTKTCI